MRHEEEINIYLDKIEELEDIIMRLEDLIPVEDVKKKTRKRKRMDSKLAIEFDEKNKKFRELKDKMGFLRKENSQLRQELEKIKHASSSTRINIEDLRPEPLLSDLVQELQYVVNIQRLTISNLKTNKVNKEDILEKLRDKEEEIKLLKSEISQLNPKN
jgi:chromosome segregation ATPase